MVTYQEDDLIGPNGVNATTPGLPGTSAPLASETENSQNFGAIATGDVGFQAIVTGGIAGLGKAGLNGTGGVDTVKTSGSPNGGDGQDGGNNGKGGDALLTLDGDLVGSIGTPHAGIFVLNAQADGGAAGGTSQIAKGGDGGYGNNSFGTPSVYGLAGSGGAGGDGGAGGAGGSATVSVDTLTVYDSGAATPGSGLDDDINLQANGAAGHVGAGGGYGGAGYILGAVSGGLGGNGGAGGAGGAASISLTNAILHSAGALTIQATASGGAGAQGGGGQAGGASSGNNYNGFAGNGGNGGASGAATIVVNDIDAAATAISIALDDVVQLGGGGGKGGVDPGAPINYQGAVGQTGAIGAMSTTLTNSTFRVTAAQSTLTLKLDDAIATKGVQTFNGASGGDLTFSGNTFVGTGTDTLNLAVAGGGVNVDFIDDRIAIGGSAWNTLQGFNAVNLDKDDTVEIAPGANVTVNTDPDTIVIANGHVGGTVTGANSTNTVFEFVGFSGLTLAQLNADTTYNGTTTTLNVGGGSVVIGTTDSSKFTFFATDTQGVACFLRGTRIATRDGEAPIESLRAGDVIRTASGDLRPVRWLGRRRLRASRHPRPEEVWPVLVEAGAFASGVPARDLWLSPGHNVDIGGALAPIVALVNGASIRQVARETLEYWHVELVNHDLLLSEGLASESYLDTGNRGLFQSDGPLTLHPDLGPRRWTDTCLPLHLDGPLVEAAAARLRARAAPKALDGDDHLHLIADGRRLAPLCREQGRVVFEAPPDARTLALASRTFVPMRELGTRDCRTLGVCVGALALDGVDFDLTAAPGAGWHDYEPENRLRWTDGLARLPAGVRRIEIALVGQGSYARAAA